MVTHRSCGKNLKEGADSVSFFYLAPGYVCVPMNFYRGYYIYNMFHFSLCELYVNKK